MALYMEYMNATKGFFLPSFLSLNDTSTGVFPLDFTVLCVTVADSFSSTNNNPLVTLLV